MNTYAKLILKQERLSSLMAHTSLPLPDLAGFVERLAEQSLEPPTSEVKAALPAARQLRANANRLRERDVQADE